MIQHPAVVSPIYQLRKTLELDVRLSGERVPVRIELFQSVAHSRAFRCRVRSMETAAQLQAILAQVASEEGTEEGRAATESLIGLHVDYEADDETSALLLIFEDLLDFLGQTTGEDGEIDHPLSPAADTDAP